MYNLYSLTDVMNEVFGIPLLLNFAASSVLVCFVGFRLTVGISPEQFLKLMLILVSAMIEIYLLCSFSQMLIDAVCCLSVGLILIIYINIYFQSESVSIAAWDMSWMEADTRFRKMLIFIALRAQRPVCLKATVFLDVSIQTMSSVSYLGFFL